MMRALRWHARQDVRLDDVAEPTLVTPGWALVEVDLCGICGTDLGEYKSGPRLITTTPHPLTRQSAPVTLGHEIVGRIRATSDSDSKLADGTRVILDAALRCGNCAACLDGDYNRCRFGGSV